MWAVTELWSFFGFMTFIPVFLSAVITAWEIIQSTWRQQYWKKEMKIRGGQTLPLYDIKWRTLQFGYKLHAFFTLCIPLYNPDSTKLFSDNNKKSCLKPAPNCHADEKSIILFFSGKVLFLWSSVTISKKRYTYLCAFC